VLTIDMYVYVNPLCKLSQVTMCVCSLGLP